MKKSQFITLLLGVFGTLLFALGMCMSMIPEWNLFKEGIMLGCIALLELWSTYLIYRHMEHKPRFHITLKVTASLFLGLLGVMAFGCGMCLSMVYGQMLAGIGLGVLGILILLCLIPVCKGLE